MSPEQVGAFLIFALVTSITPGPNNIMLAATGANVGIRRGLPHMFGIAFGFGLMVFLVAAGAGAAFLEKPLFLQTLRYAGAAILLWLAWKIATAGRAGTATRERPISFTEAVAFQWINPKAWLISVGAATGFLQPGDASPVLQAALFAGLFILAGAPCMMVWLGFGAAMQRVLRSDRSLGGFNIVMGLLLAGTAFVMV